MKFLETPDKGQGLHCQIVKLGLQKETLVKNTIVDNYAKLVFIVEAKDVFQRLQTIDVVSRTMMIRLIEHRCFYEILNCFERMSLISRYALNRETI